VSEVAPLILLRDVDLHDPEPRGRCDVLIGGTRVLAIAERIDPLPASLCEVVELGGAIVTPGLVDAHVHVTGGGGEAGYASKVPTLKLTELSLAGVTTVVGLLGTDSTTRSVRELVARTYGLREEGLSAWCWTGSYEVPVKTLTGSIRDDIVFIDPVIGVGELAISDHRSSQPSFDEFLRVAADVHVGGLMTGKAGVLHLHLGDGKRGLDLIRRALATSELPARVFHPTHLNRNPELFEEARALAGGGEANRIPWFDLTAFPEGDIGEGFSAAEAIAIWKREGLPLDRLTCSSDGGGCMPHFDALGQVSHYGVGQSTTLLATIRQAITEHGMTLAELLPLFTRNVASLLRLPAKGHLQVGADADLLVLDREFGLDAVLARGHWLVRDGQAVVCGPFE
jgi:beta-aspartyl-dipeptidase (metallo-type)